jgi:hypothetical protein
MNFQNVVEVSHTVVPLEHINTCMGDYRRGLDWQLDLLTTYRS